MIYLDNAATSFPKPTKVIDEMSQFMTDTCANPGRAGHKMASQVAERIFDAREIIAEFFNVEDSRQVIFTQNVTMSLNMVIQGVLKRGDTVVTSSMEHNSVMRPLRHLEAEGFIQLHIAKANLQGELSPEAVLGKMDQNTSLVVINHGSNVNGVIQNISAIAQQIKMHYPQTNLLIDAAQTAGAVKIDLKRLDPEFFAFTGHKGLLGPQGTGGLILKKGVSINPLMLGGTGSHSEHEFHPKFLPDKLESGTPNSVGIIGLAEGIKFLQTEGLEKIIRHERLLRETLVNELKKIKNCKLYESLSGREKLGVLSFNLTGVPCSEVGQRLNDDFEIYTRTGLHCSPTSHKTLGTFPHGTVRISLSYFTSLEDIEFFISSLKELEVELCK